MRRSPIFERRLRTHEILAPSTSEAERKAENKRNLVRKIANLVSSEFEFMVINRREREAIINAVEKVLKVKM